VSVPSWQPNSTPATLRLRAQLLAQARGFFAERGVIEVDTPLLVQRAVTDPQLQSAEVRLPGHDAPLFLITSPEYAMKRLLAAGCGDIYQMSHVFRGEEAGRLHNAEFMLIEWYRAGFSMQDMMRETAQLAALLLARPDAVPELLSYTQAFQTHTGMDPARLDARAATQCTQPELMDWLMASVVGPRLGHERLCCLHHYPASQASLARLDPADERFALRFELYCKGVELANGFEELGDAAEQRARFEADRRARRSRGLAVHALDERLLAALEKGLPAVAGVALGFDRLLLLRTGADALDEVMPFALGLA
jgi:lysyl-tRNA synthetase class 2